MNGILADFTGSSEELTKDEYATVVREYPRLNLADGIKEIYCGFCRIKPETTRDNAVGQVGQAHIEAFQASPDWYVLYYWRPEPTDFIRFLHLLSDTTRQLDSYSNAAALDTHSARK